MSNTQPSQTLRTHFYTDDKARLTSYNDVKSQLTTLARTQPETPNIYIVSTQHKTTTGNYEKILSFSLNVRRPERNGNTVRSGVVPLDAIKFLASERGDKSLLSFDDASGTDLSKKNCELLVASIIEMRAAYSMSQYKSASEATMAASKELFNYLDEKSGGCKKFSADVLAELTAAKLSTPENKMTKSKAGETGLWKERLKVLNELQRGMHSETLSALGYDPSKIHKEVEGYVMIEQNRWTKDKDSEEYISVKQHALRKTDGVPSYTENRKEHQMKRDTSGFYIDPREPEMPSAKETGVMKVNVASAHKPRQLSEELVEAHDFLLGKIGGDAVKSIPQRQWVATMRKLKETTARL